MELTHGEKLIALMLADLLKPAQKPSGIDADFVAECISSDELWALSWKYEALAVDSASNPPEVEETLLILDMCAKVEGSLTNLSKADRHKLGAVHAFVGFDANNEASHYSVAKTLITRLDRYPEFAGRPLNKHAPSLDKYERMLKAYEPIKEKWPLNLQEINAVLNA